MFDDRRDVADSSGSSSSDVFSVRRLEWGAGASTSFARGGAPPVAPRSTHSFLKIAANNNVIVLGTRSGCVLRWNLEGGAEPEEIEVSRRAEDEIHKLFVDATGSHAFISLKSGDNFYLHGRSQRPKKVSKILGVVECVAFDRQQGTETNTKSFLVGTSLGYIYELSFDSSGKEKLCQQVYQLETPQPITSLHIETFAGSGAEAGSVPGASGAAASAAPSAGNAGGAAGGGAKGADDSGVSRIFVMCSTPSPTRLYLFLGGPGYTQVFSPASLGGESPSFTELPGSVASADLYCFNKPPHTRAQTFALTTELGIYHGSFLFSSTQTSKDNIINESSLLSYEEIRTALVGTSTSLASLASTILSISVSEFHFFVLQAHQLLAISKLNGTVVQAARFDSKPGNRPLCLSRDESKNVIWLLTESAVHQVVLINEDRNVWAVYLERALRTGDERNFDAAYQYCRKADDRATVHRVHAEYYLSKRRLDMAAIHYAKSDVPFEDVVLTLVTDPADRDSSSSGSSKPGVLTLSGPPVLFPLRISDHAVLAGLCAYLTEKLRVMSTASKSQRTMVCTWLCELLLQRIAALEMNSSLASAPPPASSSLLKQGSSGSQNADLDDLINQFKDFIRSNKAYLDQAVTLGLLVSRGMRGLLLFYVKLIGDYDYTLTLMVSAGALTDAVAVMRSAPVEKIESSLYRLLPLLIVKHPEATAAMLVNKPGLKLKSLLPALLRYSEALDAQYESRNIRSSASHHPSISGGGAAMVGRESFGGYNLDPLDVDSDDNQVNFAVFIMEQYIVNCLAEGNTPEPLAYHTLVYLLAKYDGPEETGLVALFQGLIDRLEQSGRFAQLEGAVEGAAALLGPDEIDLQHCLRVCQRYNRSRSRVLIYVLLCMPSAAVSAALSIDLEWAKRIAGQSRDDASRKSLWLSIATHIIANGGDVKDALALLQESGGLIKIEDVLPLLPDFTEIDAFKDHICATLEVCGQRIENLQHDMDELSSSADEIQRELDAMKLRGYSTSSHQRCEYCSDALFDRQFYLFPCGHGYHCNCALREAPTILGHDPRALLDCQKAAMTIDALTSKGAGGKDGLDKRAAAKIDLLQTELDGYIAAECAFCGSVMIRLVAEPLISPAEAEEAKSWLL